MKIKRIVFLVSGRGGSLIFLQHAISVLQLPWEIVGVIGDRKCNALEYAKNEGIFCKEISYSRKDNIELKRLLINLQADLIVTNIHKILDSEIVNLFKNKLINLHYSILPSFAGLIGMDTIAAARSKNCTFLGTTTHIVDDIVDNGQIISQNIFPVDWSVDSLAELQDTLYKSGCLNLLNAIFLQSSIQPKLLREVLINKRNVIFSPHLQVDIDLLDYIFWVEIKKLA